MEKPKIAIVSSKELDSNCWVPARFVEGVRCLRVMKCTYLEKKTCRVVDAEIAHLHEQKRKTDEDYHAKVSMLIAQQVYGPKIAGKQQRGGANDKEDLGR